ncbi:MAG: 54S ribosomal protein L22, mitochondrial [Piccolia ochrophora]|nr:MAG: 54S ribosomal protein L22, mitochondrial [Piccolia ochrophora]
MSLHSSSRRLTLSALGRRQLKSPPSACSSPLLPLLLPHPISRRTLFGRTARKPGLDTRPSTDDNPIYNDLLKMKDKPPTPPPMVRGDLASNSIFETEDAGSTTDPSLPKQRKFSVQRDLSAMSAKLDPRPETRKRWERNMAIRLITRRGRLSRTQTLKRTERESLSKSHMLKTSVKKLNPIARQITGKSVEDAIVQMRFSKKGIARSVKEELEHARNEAIVRRGMGLGKTTNAQGQPTEIRLKDHRRHVVTDRTGLYVDQAWVGRGTYGKEPEFRARGQINFLRPPHTSISILLKEEATRVRQHEERERKKDKRKLWTALPNRPITTQRSYYCW